MSAAIVCELPTDHMIATPDTTTAPNSTSSRAVHAEPVTPPETNGQRDVTAETRWRRNTPDGAAPTSPLDAVAPVGTVSFIEKTQYRVGVDVAPPHRCHGTGGPEKIFFAEATATEHGPHHGAPQLTRKTAGREAGSASDRPAASATAAATTTTVTCRYDTFMFGVPTRMCRSDTPRWSA